MELGKYNQLTVARKVGIGYYLSDDEDNDVLLPEKWAPEGLNEGDSIEVFIYLDNEERPIATTLKPKAVLGDFAYLQVNQVSSFGAFLHWGIEKDLFVPFAEQEGRMQEGKSYMVYIYLDEMTQRITASAKIDFYVEKENIDLKEGQEVELLIGKTSDLGYNVIINNTYQGLLFANEVFKPIQPGQKEQGYIKNIRKDLKIDVSLQKQGYSGIEPNAQKILLELKKKQGFLPLHDKSAPEDITHQLQMSKKVFKKAIGALYKEKLIIIKEDGIYLV